MNRSRAAAAQRDARGNTTDRAARRRWLLAAFDPLLGPNAARCRLQLARDCADIVDHLTLTVDRIVPGGPYTRDNIQPACAPCQHVQGGAIGTQRRARPCLVCEQPCLTEGQLCPDCVAAGHRVTDHEVIVNLGGWLA